MAARDAKQYGVHYTPPDLADFLSDVVLAEATLPHGPITVLDPACGSGELLNAVCRRVAPDVRKRLRLIGYETDAVASQSARDALRSQGTALVEIRHQDFLTSKEVAHAVAGTTADCRIADLIIANPPYVRTQVLGARRARELAARFELSGRIDLYQPFAKAMTTLLKPRGVLGLLTSNRFLSVQSGQALRKLLHELLELRAVFDLGDTRLFGASVLPAIVVGRQRELPEESTHACRFARIYLCRTDPAHADVKTSDSVLNALRCSEPGEIEIDSCRYQLERGALETDSSTAVWRLATDASRRWLGRLAAFQDLQFHDVAHVRVGVKTTADDVFVQDWNQLPLRERPEASLLRPLITHHVATAWASVNAAGAGKQILYPHVSEAGRRRAVDLSQFPNAERILLSHKSRLHGRQYLRDAGREWYEIWVPHQPADWQQPKIVYPDISEEPKFWIDTSGAVVNGDCYWITSQDAHPDWLPVMLAVANSSLALRFYDTRFHNKLYGGRRRFMSQYVRQFPLPKRTASPTQEVVRVVREGLCENRFDAERICLLDHLVWEAFGFDEATCDATETRKPSGA